jgi:chemotaxis protein MotB
MAEAADKKPGDAPAGEAAPPLEPVVKKKMIEAGHAGAHGGAWKIALADMMTAMMAFFLLMWLLGATTEDQRKSIADYFKPVSHSAVNMSRAAGTGGIMGGESILDPDGMPYAGQRTSLFERDTPRSEAGKKSDSGTSQDEKNDMNSSELSEQERQKIAAETDKKNFDKLEKEVKEALEQNPQLDKIKDQVKFIREKDGLRIEVIDKADFSMFGMGTARMQGKAETLIREVAKSVAGMPNKIAVRGHTDSLAYDDGVRSNWSLSGDRAESTRRIMEAAGIPSNRFAKIEGVADTAPYIPNNPADPRNRRISITIQFQNKQEQG